MKPARVRSPACLAAPAQAKAWPTPGSCWRKSPRNGPKLPKSFGPVAQADSALLLGPDVQHHGVIDYLKAVLLGNFLLAPFNGLVKKLEHLAGLKANHVVVMVPLIQLITGLLYPAGAVIKNMLAHQMGRLKLRQYPIYGGQTDFLALVHQRAVNIRSEERRVGNEWTARCRRQRIQ